MPRGTSPWLERYAATGRSRGRRHRKQGLDAYATGKSRFSAFTECQRLTVRDCHVLCLGSLWSRPIAFTAWLSPSANLRCNQRNVLNQSRGSKVAEISEVNARSSHSPMSLPN